jgi:hypothetical protein
MLRPNDVMRFYGIPVLDATYLVSTIDRFIASSDRTILAGHVPPEVPLAQRDLALEQAIKLWEEVKNVDNTMLRMPHDGYLKLFQLSNPDLSSKYQAILFDEFQDANLYGCHLHESAMQEGAGWRPPSIDLRLPPCDARL